MTKLSKIYPAYYWDTCIFISIVEENPDRVSVLDEIIEECENKKVHIYTSILTITEFAFAKVEKDKKVLHPEIEKKIDSLWQRSSPIKLVDFHALIAFEAKNLIREILPRGWTLKPADAIHLITAKYMGVSEFHTYDDRLFKYSEILRYKIQKP